VNVKISFLTYTKWVWNNFYYFWVNFQKKSNLYVKKKIYFFLNLKQMGPIFDCQALLQQHSNFKISFARRQTNYVTHNLTGASRLHAHHQQSDLIPFWYWNSFEKWNNDILIVKKKNTLHQNSLNFYCFGRNDVSIYNSLL